MNTRDRPVKLGSNRPELRPRIRKLLSSVQEDAMFMIPDDATNMIRSIGMSVKEVTPGVGVVYVEAFGFMSKLNKKDLREILETNSFASMKPTQSGYEFVFLARRPPAGVI